MTESCGAERGATADTSAVPGAMPDLFFRTELAGAENGEAAARRVLAIDSGLSPEAFAKSRRAAQITESGILLSPDGTESPWRLGGTLVRDGRVCVYGNDFAGENLRSLLCAAADEAQKTEAWRTLVLCARVICKSEAAIRAAARTGPAGIFAGAEAGEITGILILPPELFTRCVSSMPEAAAFGTQTVWVHPDCGTVPPEQAFAFSTACAAYRILAGHAPFRADSGGKETFAQMVETKAFVRAEDAVWGITPEAAARLNALIQGETEAGKTLRAKDAISALESLSPDFAAVFDGEKRGQQETETFREKRNAAGKQIERKILLNQKIKTYRTAALAVAAAALALAGIVFFLIQRAAKMPDTEGLAPREVAERFYGAVETLDPDIPKAYTLKGGRNRYIDAITDISIQIKMRQAFRMENTMIHPAFFYVAADTPALLAGKQVYGVTRLQLEELRADGATAEYGVSFFWWQPFPAPASYPEEEAAEEGMPEGEAQSEAAFPLPLAVYGCRDKVTLTFTGEKWLIADIETEEEEAVRTSPAEIMQNALAYSKGEAGLLFFAPEAERIDEERQKRNAAENLPAQQPDEKKNPDEGES